MSKHTPGRWRVELHKTPQAHQFRIFAGEQKSGRCVNVADCNPYLLDEREANANLIAAAPDLLAALQAGVDNEMPMGDWLRMARAALALAQGGNTEEDNKETET